MFLTDTLANPDASATIARFIPVPGGLIPALHALQHRFGYVDRRLIPELAEAFNVTDAEVHGVITYYPDSRPPTPTGPSVPGGRAAPCLARGGLPLPAALAPRGGDDAELVDVYCLGNCALGPSAAVDGTLLAHATADRVVSVVRSRRSEQPVERSEQGAAPDPSAPVVYVPRDAAARSVGADAVADAFAAAGARVVRNGSRGMLWLEPLVEIVTDRGRVAYGPVAPADVSAILDDRDRHHLHLGPTDELPWMARQRRVTFARVGVVDPRSSDDFEDHGGNIGLRTALAMEPGAVVTEITESGLRGRGGAAFPAGIKMRTVLDAPGDQKYVVCNADEGDSGTFADRMLIEGDPFTLIEGMTIAGWATGASEGYVYIRSEYPDAIDALEAAIEAAEARGWLGDSVLGTGFAFRLHVRVGAGSYVCGEETALLESLEGKRGEVRAKPPLPALAGLWGKPTLVNNVITLATMPMILADGGAAYSALGSGRSRGTCTVQLAGNIAHGGLFETEFGTPLGEMIDDIGGGTASRRPVRAVQVGGPLGSYLPVEQLGLGMDYEELSGAGALLGHGGVVVFDDTVDMAAQARFAMEFCAVESCGKCTPCRIGSTRGVELIDKITAGVDREANIDVLVDLCEVMTDASLCAMGGLTPLPVRSALTHFTEDFQHERHDEEVSA